MISQNGKGDFSWYVVITHASQERQAKFHLERQGFRTYLPMRAPLTLRRRRSGATPEPRPMFPRYLFVAVDLAAPGWRSIYSTIGVHSVITSGIGETARPAAAPNTLIRALKDREIAGLVVLPPRDQSKPCSHRKGDRILVTGSTADFDAVFEERVDDRRVAVLLSLLGRESRQVVALDAVKRAPVR